MSNNINFINPDELLNNPAFSQIAVTKGSGNTIYIGGQNAVTKAREITGKGNIGLQTEYALKNIESALRASGASVNDLFKLTIYIVQGQVVQDSFKGASSFMQQFEKPPVISVIVVAGLAHPDYLVEIEAIAFKAD